MIGGGSILHCPIDLCLLEACTNQNISKMENGRQLELSILLEKVTLLQYNATDKQGESTELCKANQNHENQVIAKMIPLMY